MRDKADVDTGDHGRSADHSALAAVSKHLAGTAALTGLGAAIGGLWGLTRSSTGRSATVGAVAGMISSLGFGKDIYDSLAERPSGASHVSRLQRERSQERSRSR